MASQGFRAWVNSPAGPKTTHFWGPVANWGFVLAVRARGGQDRPLPRGPRGPRCSTGAFAHVLRPSRASDTPARPWDRSLITFSLWLGGVLCGSQAVMDMNKPAEMISGKMTGVLSFYSILFMRFAWMVKPRNYILLACHASNEAAQLYQLSRWANHTMCVTAASPKGRSLASIDRRLPSLFASDPHGPRRSKPAKSDESR